MTTPHSRRHDPSGATGGVACCVRSGELGIALSGGGARALAQVGVLKVLEREAIPIRYVAGTSGGAIVGAVYVTSADADEAETRLLAHLRGHGIGFNVETFAALAAPDRRPGVIDVVRGLWQASRHQGGLIGGGAMRDALRVLLGPGTFATTRLRFATTALDLVSGRRTIFADGPLVEAVYASSAIPGLFEPLVIDDYCLVDGGWAEPVPVDSCHHLGAVHVVAVDVAAPDGDEFSRGALPTALRADELARALLEESQVRTADFVVRPQVSVRHFADFSEPEALIAAGERAAEAVLPEIRAVLERHHSLFIRRLP